VNITEIELYQFALYKHAIIKLIKDGLYLILGKNKLTGFSIGSGKSYLIGDSISFALYGNGSRCIRAGDNLITDNTDKMSVKITFIKNNKRSIVLRKRTRGKTTKLTINGKCGNSIKETQAVLEKIIGMDYDTFRHSVYFEQKKMNSFSELSPSEAKEVLMRILQLAIWDGYYKRAKEIGNDLSLKHSEIEMELSLLKDIDVSPNTESRINTENRIAIIQKQVAEIKKQYTEYLVIEGQREEIKKQVNELKSKRYHHTQEVERLKRKATKFKQLDECPTCFQQVETEYKKGILKGICAEELKEQQYIDKLDVQIKEKVDTLPKSMSDKVEQLQEQDNDLREKLGNLKAKLVSIEKVAKEFKEIKNKKANLAQNKKLLLNKINIYTKLMNAFGKNGIQAYIIDNIIPELNNITNDIISKVSDFRLGIQTQKQLKSGKEAETLDIIISDSTGDRPYYNYSGGEKTLIDFALRIALSIILSRRSGAQIETLILDEPFSSLDAQNKMKVMSAISYVKNKFQFRKIFLITHDYELQGNCENVVEVIRDRNGSRIG